MSFPFIAGPVALTGVLLASLFCVSGCTTTAPKPDVQPDTGITTSASVHKNAVRNVVRYGRYTLVELTPEVAQSDLMAQIIDVTIPLSQGMAETNVGEAMRYVLQRSGYRLCEPSTAFDQLPLPVAHTHLGPIELRDALVVLAGSAWQLQIDEAARQVCFVAVSDKTQKQEEVQ